MNVVVTLESRFEVDVVSDVFTRYNAPSLVYGRVRPSHPKSGSSSQDLLFFYTKLCSQTV
jgi:hypothetical protein